MHTSSHATIVRALTVVLSLLLTDACPHVFGQGCDLLLRDGVFNSFSHTSGSYSNGTWHQAWCSGTLRQTSSSGSTGVSLDVVVESIPIGLGFSDAQQFQAMYQSKFCSATDRTQIDLRSEAAFQKTADPTLMGAYVQCKKVEGKGLETEFSESLNHQVFSVTMRYIPAFVAGNAKPRLKSIDFAPATAVRCTGTIKPPMLLDENSNSMQCQRLSDVGVSVLINTDVGAFTRDLPPATPPPSDQERVLGALPQGTVLLWASKKAIPAGWHVCNGELGTPDMTDRAPIGTIDASKVGSTTGEATHNHTGHGTAEANITKTGWGPGFQYEGEGSHTTNHTHPVTVVLDPHSSVPPSTWLRFIMKL